MFDKLRQVYSLIFGARWFMGILLIVLGTAAITEAQEPTAKITALSGAVFVSIQGTGDVPAQAGMVLKAGDTIQTKAGAGVDLTLSEGSALKIGENTKLDLTALTQTAKGARQSKLKVFWGRVRMWLSPGHQKEGSEFTVDTLNAQVGVKFSQPDLEIGYDTAENITIIRTYTVAVSVRNLLTGAEIMGMPAKHQAIVKEDVIIVSKITEVSSLLDRIGQMPPDKQMQTALDALTDTRQPATGAVSSAPGVVGLNSLGISPLAAQGNRPERPERVTEPVGVTFTVAPK